MLILLDKNAYRYLHIMQDSIKEAPCVTYPAKCRGMRFCSGKLTFTMHVMDITLFLYGSVVKSSHISVSRDINLQ